MSKFAGFPAQASEFLGGIELNNTKEWFEANREAYKLHLLDPAIAFVSALGEKLLSLDPKLSAIPKVNGSLFRINRDIRFSADKTPYKHHLDVRIWHGEDRKAGTSSFFFRMYAERLIVGAGIHGFDPKRLALYRKLVAGPKGEELAKLVAKLEKSGFDVGTEHYKRAPRGYDPEHPRARLLRFNALHAGVELPLPPETRSAKLVPLCMRHYRKLAPLHSWLAANL